MNKDISWWQDALNKWRWSKQATEIKDEGVIQKIAEMLEHVYMERDGIITYWERATNPPLSLGFMTADGLDKYKLIQFACDQLKTHKKVATCPCKQQDFGAMAYEVPFDAGKMELRYFKFLIHENKYLNNPKNLVQFAIRYHTQRE